MICDLLDVLPLPDRRPVAKYSHLRRNIEWLGTLLPDDYVAFGALYGSGQIHYGTSWHIWSPFSRNLTAFHKWFRSLQNEFRDYFNDATLDGEFGIYPDPGGLLPCGTTDDGAWLCFLTRGDASQWKMIQMTQYQREAIHKWDLTFSGLWAAAFRGEVTLKGIDIRLLENPEFTAGEQQKPDNIW